MGKSQPQFLIEKFAKDGDWPKGAKIVYTGPASAKPKGWRIIGRILPD